VLPNHFPRAGFFEPFGRTFMCLEFGHDLNYPGSFSLAQAWVVAGSPVFGYKEDCCHSILRGRLVNPINDQAIQQDPGRF
jgi:hypothetical protein